MKLRPKLILIPAIALATIAGGLALSAGAANAATGSTCAESAPASNSNLFGWFVTSTQTNFGCFDAQQWELTSWYDIPVGNTIWICASPNVNDYQSVGFQPTGQTSSGQCPATNLGYTMLQVERASVGAPVINPGGVVNDTGGYITLYGVDFYPSDTVYTGGTLAQVTFDSLALGQINAKVNPGVCGSFVNVQVMNAFGELSNSEFVFISC